MSENLSDNRRTKEGKVGQIRDGIKDAGLVVVLVQNGLDADQTLALRRAMRAAGVTMKVEKNTLVKLAIKGTPLAGLEPFMKGPTALAYSKDPVAAAKVAAEFAKKNGEKFKKLYDEGDFSDYGSQSEADAALCAIIAFRTGPDPDAIDAVFRDSALYRDK